MALIHSFEKNGNFLFKYRGQIPVFLFLMAIPVVYLTDYQFIDDNPGLFYGMLIICSLVSLLGQVIRAVAIGTSQKFTSGRNTKEQVAEALNTKGIYSTMRHPLYVGNYFMWIGIVMFTMNLWFIVIVSLLFWVYYERIMFAEERFLERKFGEDYVEWSMKVPPFFPSWKSYESSNIRFSLKTILRREYSGITATIIGFLFVEMLRNFFEDSSLEWNQNYTIVAAVGLGITLILRTLKHKTSLLNEEGRS
jgi:protein-S-isoprenylcysteine O-methyltransferase Ste14